MNYPVHCVQLHLLRVPGSHVGVEAAAGGPVVLLPHRVVEVVVPGRAFTYVLCAHFTVSVDVTSVRVADRLIYFCLGIGAFSYIQVHGLIHNLYTYCKTQNWILRTGKHDRNQI